MVAGALNFYVSAFYKLLNWSTESAGEPQNRGNYTILRVHLNTFLFSLYHKFSDKLSKIFACKFINLPAYI
jgi:hypothetical protein